MTMRRTVQLSGVLATLIVSAGVADAARVVVLGGASDGAVVATTERDALIATLESAGHSVTAASALPGTLWDVDVVWRIGGEPMTKDEAGALAAFVASGRGVILLGEAGAPELAASLQDFVQTLTQQPIELSPTAAIDGTHAVNPDARGGVAAAPEKLTVWHPHGAGSIGNVRGANILTRDGEGIVSAAIWGDPDLGDTGGRIIAMMDRGWIDGSTDANAMIVNTTEFLSHVVQICGDGVRNGYEACDDGNTSDADDCTSTCQVAFCGDGLLQVGAEECDDGLGTDDGACLSTCVEARCGDGVVRSGVETCDDGNTADDDGCSALCEIEPIAPQAHQPVGTATEDGAPAVDLEVSGELADADAASSGCAAAGGSGSAGTIALIGVALALAARRRRSL